METRIDILNELMELSPLMAGMEKLNVFTVPEGYFEGFADLMLGISKAGEPSILDEIPRHGYAEVPVGYFDDLADTIMARIKAGENETAASELRSLSPMLYSIQNENVFEVPQGYFAELPDVILGKIQTPATKVITMRRRSTTFMKYAVAAAFTGMMALGVFKFTGINNTGNGDPIVKLGLDIAKENKVDEEMAKVSDADIVKYLESTGSDVKTAMVANSVDDNTLPSQEDYMLDEKTLDNYLNTLNVNDLKN